MARSTGTSAQAAEREPVGVRAARAEASSSAGGRWLKPLTTTTQANETRKRLAKEIPHMLPTGPLGALRALRLQLTTMPTDSPLRSFREVLRCPRVERVGVEHV